ncbi:MULTISPECIES: type II toxin-antitoxin system PemK/MazF family toxin [unclassified Nocardioides]|uniref:type II toxin-antitoxin system PemK/MazF family toxin n=1 Tax=unclassified Nocardioides TaxID=2615069 RepID=UPI002665C341|nr:type II toxin-antitoxin system PemK/MazF family toxin [Nocardioides sp. Arc9.136]WKN49367.1 type II toxin-antitoxin system PemK/MazF family toxin [Nocardioides sp. Arc9.136]
MRRSRSGVLTTLGRRLRRPRARSSYAPQADGRPDPGEVVWAWVPYEDDPRQGKDRPVLVIARVQAPEGERLLALMLTSKDHDRDAADEARWGRHWMDVGSGGWDRERRPSEVRLDRLLQLDPASVRREGAALDRGTFDAVVAAAAPYLSRGRSPRSGARPGAPGSAPRATGPRRWRPRRR